MTEQIQQPSKPVVNLTEIISKEEQAELLTKIVYTLFEIPATPQERLLPLANPTPLETGTILDEDEIDAHIWCGMMAAHHKLDFLQVDLATPAKLLNVSGQGKGREQLIEWNRNELLAATLKRGGVSVHAESLGGREDLEATGKGGRRWMGLRSGKKEASEVKAQ